MRCDVQRLWGVCSVLLGVVLVAAGLSHLSEITARLNGGSLFLLPLTGLLKLVSLPLQLCIGIGMVLFPSAVLFRVSAIVLFIGFAAFNGVSYFTSAPPCRCIPAFEFSHLSMLFIDLLLIAAIVCSLSVKDVSSMMTNIAKPMAVCGFALVALAGLSFWVEASKRANDDLRILHHTTGPKLGLPATDQASINVLVHNSSSEEVKIFGATVTCQCTAITGLPIVVGPGEYRAVPVLLKGAAGAGEIVVPVSFWTDSKSNPLVSFNVSAVFR